MNNKTVGRIIKKLRLEKGYTQKELGKLLCRSEDNISSIENGNVNITLEIITTVATALKVEVEDILGLKKQEKSEAQELRIYIQEERLQVASILVKNGYTVRQSKRNKTQTGKQLDYFLEVSLEEDSADTSR